MADKVLCEKSDLVAVANAIRSKNGTTNTYKVNQLASAVENISSGTTLPTLSNPGSAADLRSGKQLIDQSGNKITGTLATVTQATPSITVNSAGLITASTTQSAGYVASGTKSATKQLATKSAATITPGTSNQTIAAGTYLTGAQTIKGDANLVAGNIKSGVSIFGVSGSYKDSIPIEISTDAGMEAVLTSNNVGKVYKFTGTSSTYTNGDLYVVEVG